MINSTFSIIKKGAFYLKINGLLKTVHKVVHYLERIRINKLTDNEAYQKWIKNCEEINQNDVRSAMIDILYKPLFTIFISLDKMDEQCLNRCLTSIKKQYYDNWTICIIIDYCIREQAKEFFCNYIIKKNNVKIIYLQENQNMEKTINSEIKISEGEFITMMDSEDQLSYNALLEVVKLLQQYPNADIIYSDEDEISDDNKRKNPYFKPHYCPDTLLSYDYISHLSIYRKELVEMIGGYRTQIVGAQEYDLLLRMTECTDKIHHISKVLYHRRNVDKLRYLEKEKNQYIYFAGKRALEDAVYRRGYRAKVQLLENIYCYNVVFYPTKEHLVSIIIPTKDKAEVLEKCLESIYKKTITQQFEIIVVDNNSNEKKTFELFDKYSKKENFKVLKLPIPFNYSKLNNEASKIAKGDMLLFLNNDVEIITDDWLLLMVGEAEREEIGAVGTKLIYPDNTIQHAGIMVGFCGSAGNIGYRENSDVNGYMNCYKIRKNYSAVTAACLMVRKNVMEKIGGFDEKLAVDYNDVDLCLKIQKAGYRNIYLPDVILYHYESLSRGNINSIENNLRNNSEKEYLQKKWGEELEQDPCINKNFDLNFINFKVKTSK